MGKRRVKERRNFCVDTMGMGRAVSGSGNHQCVQASDLRWSLRFRVILHPSAVLPLRIRLPLARPVLHGPITPVTALAEPDGTQP